LRTWIRDLDKSLENLANIGSEAVDSVKFVLEQTEMPNDKDNSNGQAYFKDPQELEDPDVENDDLDFDHPDVKDKIPEDANDANEFCKPYMDKASVWIQSLLSNVKKNELWKPLESEVIKSKLFLYHC
jgi:coenzyme F420-reducing hydrogenase alpha subunit